VAQVNIAQKGRCALTSDALGTSVLEARHRSQCAISTHKAGWIANVHIASLGDFFSNFVGFDRCHLYPDGNHAG
jgi:hypothetical protein